MSSFIRLYYHIVFSTKNRDPRIAREWMQQLHEYMGGIVRRLEGESNGIGGTADHVHLLVELQSTHRLSDFMRELKKGSSMWIHDSGKDPHFVWQKGYGAFTVGPNSAKAVRRYIANQEEHHQYQSYRDEFVGLLKKAGIAYEERYLD